MTLLIVTFLFLALITAADLLVRRRALRRARRRHARANLLTARTKQEWESALGERTIDKR